MGGAADGDLVAPGAVDARAVPRPLRRRCSRSSIAYEGDLGDASPTPSTSSRSSPATRGSSTPARATRSCGRCSARTRSSSSTRSPTSSQRKLLLPPFHGERMQGYGEKMSRDRRPRDRELAARHPLQAAAADAGDHARDHPRDGLRRPRRASGWSELRERAARLPRPDHQPAAARARCSSSGPTRMRAHARLPPPHRPRRRADPRARSPSAARPRTSRSATTSSRCWSPPATRTAAR